MPGSARKDIVREGEIGIYHTWSRCVQRAALCGDDPYSGQNYDHRRQWIKKLLEYQASIFAVDIGNYSILSNHQHLICRTRPDIVETWSDEEVAWRWKMAWPRWQDGQWIREPTDEEVEEVLAQTERIPVLRRNLASLSWFHARWKEPIAKLANAESDKRGPMERGGRASARHRFHSPVSSFRSVRKADAPPPEARPFNGNSPQSVPTGN